jgi:diguanylate cyclase (GGDEF)-like protein
MGSHGFLALRDRSKDVVISGGSNIDRREADAAPVGLPGITEAPVVDVSDPHWGTTVVAFIVATGPTDARRDAPAAALDAHPSQRIVEFTRPERHAFVAQLPTNSYGRGHLRELRATELTFEYVCAGLDPKRIPWYRSVNRVRRLVAQGEEGGYPVMAIRRWWRQPDHYYWLTSLLASRGLQAVTCRVLAATLLGLGAVNVTMLFSPAGPAGVVPRTIAIAVATACVVMAGVWLRRRWPSKAASATFVVTGSLCIAASCLVQTHPVAGMLGCTAFAALGGYVAFFHPPRYTAFNVVVAVATSVVLAQRLAQDTDVVFAVCAWAFISVVNMSVPAACQAMVHLLGVNVLATEIDRLTGLLNQDAFYRATGALISARGRVDDRYLVVLLVTLDNFSLLRSTKGTIACERALVAVAQTLRETTRNNAIVGRFGDAEFVVADTFSSTDSSPLVERIRGAVATTPPRLTASIGVVCTPLGILADCPPQELLDELVGLAGQSMADARRGGGNQARYTVCPTPTAADKQNRFETDDPW